MKVEEVIGNLHEYVAANIPEGVQDRASDIGRIEYFLGRLGNDYAYVIELLNYSRNYVRKLKRSGEKERYEDMMDVRDALESTASAIKLKYESVSRMLTAYDQRKDEQGMYPYRIERGATN
jgi:hypothetical protein